MRQLNKARDGHGLMMVRFYSRKMVATVQNYFMLSGGNVKLCYGKKNILCAFYVST